MFYKIKKFICKIFNIKACQCDDEKDPHEEYYLDVPEPEIPVHVEKKDHCDSHTRFIKSCRDCIAITA
tara:strand:- start:324 stop:527 length:204 start_codon:yes stop_codon:yes gene_type:complete